MGWAKHSVGYHSDQCADGNIMAEYHDRNEDLDNKVFRSRAQPDTKPYVYDAGDVVGVGVNPKLSKIFFTKNGGIIGQYQLSWLKQPKLYPSVSVIDGHI